MKQIITAVLYCHQNNIVHRDIKSENILFASKKPDAMVKLIDFGISMKYEENQKIKDKIGTILYVAPEVLKGSYDYKCDIWSIGVLMYLILCGYPPFFGNSRKAVAKKIVNSKVSFRGKNHSITLLSTIINPKNLLKLNQTPLLKIHNFSFKK